MLEIILTLAGGLVLFLYAVGNLSETIKDWAGDRARDFIARFTRNVFTAIIVGIVVTTILDSSSAVIILTIVLVNAGTLTFKQAIGIVMGANIGTTVSSQIIAMDVGKYSPIALIIGLALLIISHNPKINRTGKILLYFGMLFFGLYTMENAVEPQRRAAVFRVDARYGKSDLRRLSRRSCHGDCSIVVGDGRNGNYAGKTISDIASGGNCRNARRRTRNLRRYAPCDHSLESASAENRFVSFVF